MILLDNALFRANRAALEAERLVDTFEVYIRGASDRCIGGGISRDDPRAKSMAKLRHPAADASESDQTDGAAAEKVRLESLPFSLRAAIRLSAQIAAQCKKKRERELGY